MREGVGPMKEPVPHNRIFMNDLDNVLYEVSNESPVTPANTAWQYEIIRYALSQLLNF